MYNCWWNITKWGKEDKTWTRGTPFGKGPRTPIFYFYFLPGSVPKHVNELFNLRKDDFMTKGCVHFVTMLKLGKG